MLCCASLTQLERRCSAAKDEIASLETTLKAVAVRCGEAVEAAKPVPNGACLPLGCLCLLLVEASWGWLGPDGQLLYPPHRDIEINEEVHYLYAIHTLVYVLAESQSIEVAMPGPAAVTQLLCI